MMRNGSLFTSPSMTTPEDAAAWVERFQRADEMAEGGAPLSLDGAMELLRREQAANGVRPASVDFTEQKFAKLCVAWASTTYLHRIGAPQVQTYMAKRREQGVAGQTIHHEVALLKRLFVVARRNRRLLASPFDDGAVRMPKVRNKRYDHMTREQIETVLQRIRTAAEREPAWAWQADVVEFLFLTGLRRAELARLRVDDVDPFKGTVAVRAKVDDLQVLHLAERTKAIASRLIAAADKTGHLIPSDVADPRKAEHARANTITHLIARWKDRLGLKLHGAAHVLRHSFGTELVKVPGLPFALAQRGMRHRTPAMTMRYFHESADEMRAVAEAVASGEAFATSATPPAKAAKGKRRAPRAKDANAG
ncbi:MAG: tyrosine-type recombinase/integrase [Planctomycetes bacterium]|nr:tyrosine-type recombinase/integrase [Planctomycetota bacterium]